VESSTKARRAYGFMISKLGSIILMCVGTTVKKYTAD